MKTEQIDLVIAIAECGSITKAADKLFLSQPNACHMLDSLERELGYSLLVRAHNGTKLNARGEEFLKYAGTIKRSIERISNLGEPSNVQRLTVLSYAYAFAENAFMSLCKEYIGLPNKIEFKMCTIDNLESAAEQLERGEADIAVGICRDDLFGVFDRDFRSRGILSEQLCSMPLHVTISRNHPLAQMKNAGISDFLQYPCLASIGFDRPDNYAPRSVMDYAPFLNKTIFLEPGEARVKLAAETDGFIVSTPFQKETLEKYGLVDKPVPDSSVRFFYIYCAEHAKDPLLMRYTELLNDEVNRMINDG